MVVLICVVGYQLLGGGIIYVKIMVLLVKYNYIVLIYIYI